MQFSHCGTVNHSEEICRPKIHISVYNFLKYIIYSISVFNNLRFCYIFTVCQVLFKYALILKNVPLVKGALIWDVFILSFKMNLFKI